MKRLTTAILFAFPLLAFGQGAPLRQAFTTNAATVVTNIVRGVSTNSTIHAGKLAAGGTLPALNGSAVTSLNGTAIASGTVADARLSSNVALESAANVFSASNYIAAAMIDDLTVQNNIVGAGNISANGLIGDPSFTTVSLDTSTGDFRTLGSIYVDSAAEFFSGNGAGISNLQSASLVGALPAIDGSQLIMTNIIVYGSLSILPTDEAVPLEWGYLKLGGFDLGGPVHIHQDDAPEGTVIRLGSDSTNFAGTVIQGNLYLGSGVKLYDENDGGTTILTPNDFRAVGNIVSETGFLGNVGLATNSAGVAIDDLVGGSSATGMITNQFTTNVVGQAIVGETRHSSIGSWTNGTAGVGVTNSPAGWTAQSGNETNNGGTIVLQGTSANAFIIGQGPLIGSGNIAINYANPKLGLSRNLTDFFVYYNTATGDTVVDDIFGAAVKLNKQGVTRLKVDATAVTIAYPLIVTNTVTATNGFYTPSGGYTNKTVAWLAGTGSPESAVVAPIGSMWSRTDGSTDTALYRKETGTGNTGWVAVSAGGSFDLTANHHFTSTSSNDFFGPTWFEGNVYFGPTTQIKDNAGGDAIYPSSHRLIDGSVLSINWTNRTLHDAAGAEVLNWRDGISLATANVDTFNATNVNFYGAANIRTNIAQFDVDATAFVVGTRYTNSNRRSFVTASFTLNGAAAGTAAVTLSAEQAGVTNMVKIAAGPLASLTTIEQLSLMVGPGAFYYFTDATTGTGATVAIAAGTSSRTDF